MKKPSAATTEDLVAELVAIKRLFVFALLRSGANQSEVAAALGMNQSQISRMFPTTLRSPSRRTSVATKR
jgi:hypothetical protein